MSGPAQAEDWRPPGAWPQWRSIAAAPAANACPQPDRGPARRVIAACTPDLAGDASTASAAPAAGSGRCAGTASRSPARRALPSASRPRLRGELPACAGGGYRRRGRAVLVRHRGDHDAARGVRVRGLHPRVRPGRVGACVRRHGDGPRLRARAGSRWPADPFCVTAFQVAGPLQPARAEPVTNYQSVKTARRPCQRCEDAAGRKARERSLVFHGDLPQFGVVTARMLASVGH